MNRWIGLPGLALALLAHAGPAAGVSLADGKLLVNGYGNWHYAKSDGNFYLGDDDGDWQNAEVTLSFIAKPTDLDTVHIQPFIEVTEEGVETEVDMAFAEHSFADALHLRLGIARHPFGIYTPIYDAGTLRPFMTLPTSLYSEEAGIIAESYTGIGLRGTIPFGASGWGVDYDLYGGTLNLNTTQPWEGTEEADDAEEEVIELEDMVGGKLVVTTPLDGLSFGGSVYSGKVTAEAEAGRLEKERNVCWGVQAEYWTGPATLRAEYAMQSIEKESDVKAAYVEAGYMITKNLQLAARWDYNDTALKDEELADLGDEYDSETLRHNEYALGVNWWFSPSFVVKLSYHMADGLRFATPAEGEDEGEDGGGEADTKTNTIVFGASYGF